MFEHLTHSFCLSIISPQEHQKALPRLKKETDLYSYYTTFLTLIMYVYHT
ncbi:hypothetical protein [Escherichia phage dw-ec]|nr:hypothetical protein [Escherichia phage dw-ec]